MHINLQGHSRQFFNFEDLAPSVTQKLITFADCDKESRFSSCDHYARNLCQYYELSTCNRPRLRVVTPSIARTHRRAHSREMPASGGASRGSLVVSYVIVSSKTSFSAASAQKTLRTACAQFGLDSSGAVLIRLGENALFHLPKAEMVVRIARRVWEKARKRALTDETAASPLAKRPYDLRHACVSTWLAAGVPPKKVADWAGHSLRVLLTVYAKVLDGGDAMARDQIDAVLGKPPKHGNE